MAASTLAELKAEILAEMAAAMNEAKDAMFDELQAEVTGYYIGSPRRYHRTYQLLTTPRADPVTAGGDVVNTRLYLHRGGGYTTGSHPSMEQVLKLANYGIKFRTSGGRMAKDTIGKKGFWERAMPRMENAFNSAFSSHFG